VTSAGQQNATPRGVAFVRCGKFPGGEVEILSAMYLKVDLPAEVVGCSIRFAYQAADAGHPNWGRASSPPGKETSPTGFIFIRLHAAKAPVGSIT
jgi:hypothetical protein